MYIPTVKHITKQGVEYSDLYSYELNEKRRIRLTGIIDDEMAERIIASIQRLDDVSDKDIEMIIDSPGGEGTAGLAILDAMQEAKSEIRTICSGKALSMAAMLIACGGTKGKREIYPNAEMMIHQPWGGVSGQASDVQVMAAHLVEVKQKMVKLLANATGKSMRQIRADMDRDFWLDAESAVAYGLVDRVRGKC